MTPADRRAPCICKLLTASQASWRREAGVDDGSAVLLRSLLLQHSCSHMVDACCTRRVQPTAKFTDEINFTITFQCKMKPAVTYLSHNTCLLCDEGSSCLNSIFFPFP